MSVGPNLNILDNDILIVDKKVYSLIWVGWVLVELFIKNHQILMFSGHDWSSYLISEYTRDQCQTVTGVI